MNRLVTTLHGDDCNDNIIQVMILYITGSLDEVLGPEHKKEIVRYLYNHQVYIYAKTPNTNNPHSIQFNCVIGLFYRTTNMRNNLN